MSQTSKAYFKNLLFFYKALWCVQILLGLIMILYSPKYSNAHVESLKLLLRIVATILIVIGIFGGEMLCNYQLQIIKKKAKLKEKLDAYRYLLIRKLVLLEVPFVFALICYFFTANYFYLGLAGLVFVLSVLTRPKRAKLIEELELNQVDKDLLDNPQALVA